MSSRTSSYICDCVSPFCLWSVAVLVLHPFVVVVHVGQVVGLHCVVHVVDWTLWEGTATLVESVCCWHMETNPWNSCVGHGEGQGAEHVHEVAGETKPKCTSTGFGVWQPLEVSLPVADELVKDLRRVSEKVHVEMRDGCNGATKYGTRLVELGKGCEVVVKIPCVPEKALMVGVFVSPRPGVPLRETLGWKPLLRIPSSGVWVFPGALQSLGFLDLLDAAASCVSRSTYRTAWAVCPWSGCQCSYSYGQGPAIGPHTGRGCFRYLVSVCGGLSHTFCRLGVRMGTCHQLRT